MGVTDGTSRRLERLAIDEARARRSGGYIDGPVKPEEALPRVFGDQLIDAARQVVRSYYLRDQRGLNRGIRWLEKLVGGSL
jgi:hypothetical protein